MNNISNDNEKTSTTKKKAVKKTIKKNDTTKFKDLEGKFIHIKVGSVESPATESQISDIQSKIIDLFERNSINCLAFVTHHAVTMDIIEKEN